MQAYNQLTPSFASTAQGYMSNPFGNPFFQTQQQLGTRQAQNLGGTQMSNLMQNFTNSGMLGGASSPAGMQLMGNQQRANTGLQAQLGFLNPVQNALQQQNYYSGLASQFRPLQTGQTNVQSTSGLGTWLPQVLGAGLGMAMGNPMALGSLFGLGGGGSSGYDPSMSLSNPGFAGTMNSPPSLFSSGAPSGIGSMGGYGGFSGGMPPAPMQP